MVLRKHNKNIWRKIVKFSIKEAFRSSFRIFGCNVGDVLIASIITMVFIVLIQIAFAYINLNSFDFTTLIVAASFYADTNLLLPVSIVLFWDIAR
jgi:hypothetical protein